MQRKRTFNLTAPAFKHGKNRVNRKWTQSFWEKEKTKCNLLGNKCSDSDSNLSIRGQTGLKLRLDGVNLGSIVHLSHCNWTVCGDSRVGPCNIKPFYLWMQQTNSDTMTHRTTQCWVGSHRNTQRLKKDGNPQTTHCANRKCQFKCLYIVCCRCMISLLGSSIFQNVSIYRAYSQQYHNRHRRTPTLYRAWDFNGFADQVQACLCEGQYTRGSMKAKTNNKPFKTRFALCCAAKLIGMRRRVILIQHTCSI